MPESKHLRPHVNPPRPAGPAEQAREVVRNADALRRHGGSVHDWIQAELEATNVEVYRQRFAVQGAWFRKL